MCPTDVGPKPNFSPCMVTSFHEISTEKHGFKVLQLTPVGGRCVPCGLPVIASSLEEL